MSNREYRVLSPTAILGYGFPEESFRRGLERRPHLIAVDAGSTDPGPHYLGSGKSFTDRAAVKRDLGLMIPAALELGVPCVIGTAGGSGAKPHVDWTVEIIEEIAKESGLAFTMGVIYADIDKGTVLDALDAGGIAPLGPMPEATREDVEASTHVVAQMGHEPVMAALDQGCQVVVCGRCYDPAAFAGPAIREGFDQGLAYHMGKILECAAIAATPGSGRDCVLGTIGKGSFILESMNPERVFTKTSAAAHSLYEKSNPYELPGPGGVLDLRDTVFTESSGGRVEVTGSRFIADNEHRIKLEAARPAGFRTISIAGVRDPIMISQIGEILEDVEAEVSRGPGAGIDDWQILFHKYGIDGVMGELEPVKNSSPHEVGLVIEAVAPSQEEADSVCSYARSTLLHYGYPGRVSTAGNLALLYSPSDIACGQVYRFSLYHLMNAGAEFFPVEKREVSP